MNRKGILLAGGHGTRLYPITASVNKHLLAIYDKPMYFYSLSMLMLAGINEIIIISTREALPNFQAALGDGNRLGLKISYAAQDEPNGIPEAFIIAENFLADAPSCLILGDNIFHGQNIRPLLLDADKYRDSAVIFCYAIDDSREYGVAILDSNDQVIDFIEKPKEPSQSKHAITGLYMFDNQAPTFARTLSHSARGELEITDLLRCYLKKNQVHIKQFGRGVAWLDMGTPERIMRAASYIETISNRQRLKLACLEEIAWLQGWINDEQLIDAAKRAGKSRYGTYLQNLVKENITQPMSY